MNAGRRGACPSLRKPMQTGDGLLVRIGFDDGVSPDALRALAVLAGRHGNGMLEVTARGNLQIRGLDHRSAAALADDIETLDLPLRQGIPVETGPLAGLDPEACADPRPLARRIAGEIVAEGLTRQLGPKVSVIVEGGGRLRLDDSVADVRLDAMHDGGHLFWLLSTGGTTDTAIARGVVTDGEAAKTVVDILRSIAGKGLEARGGDLDDGDMPTGLKPVVDIERRVLAHRRPVGLHALIGQRYGIGLGLPFGQTPHHLLCRLLAEAQAVGSREVRFAPHAVLPICESRAAAETLQTSADELGFITQADDVRLSITACAGAPSCASAHIATKSIAQSVSAGAAAAFGRDFRLHIAGCSKRCGSPKAGGTMIIGQPGGALVQPENGDAFEVAEAELGPAILLMARRSRAEKSGKSVALSFAAHGRSDSVADPIHRAGQ